MSESSKFDLDYAAISASADPVVRVDLDVPCVQLPYRGQAVFATARARMTEFAGAQGVGLIRFAMTADDRRGCCVVSARCVGLASEKRVAAKKVSRPRQKRSGAGSSAEARGSQ